MVLGTQHRVRELATTVDAEGVEETVALLQRAQAAAPYSTPLSDIYKAERTALHRLLQRRDKSRRRAERAEARAKLYRQHGYHTTTGGASKHH